MLSELGGEASDGAKDNADRSATARHNKERDRAQSEVHRLHVARAHARKRLEHLVQNDGHGVVQQRLAEHDDVQHVVDVDFDEGGQHGDRVDGADEGGEEEAVEPLELDAAVDGCEGEAPQGEADRDRVPQGVDDGEEKDGSDVVEKGPFWRTRNSCTFLDDNSG